MTANGFVRLIAGLAGLMGSAGVILAALSAHAGDSGRLGPASAMLLAHAPAAIAAALATAHGMVRRRPGMIAAFGLVAGAVLFASALTLRHYTGHGLFPMAAPTGGTILILSWLGLAIAAAWPPSAK